MQKFDVIPYEKFISNKFCKRRPVSFLLAYGNGSEKRVKLYEVDDMKEPICEVDIDNDGKKDFFRLTHLDEGYGKLREVLLSHKFYGQYEVDETRAFKFTLEGK